MEEAYRLLIPIFCGINSTDDEEKSGNDTRFLREGNIRQFKMYRLLCLEQFYLHEKNVSCIWIHTTFIRSAPGLLSVFANLATK